MRAAIVLIALFTVPALADEPAITGRAEVIDGDTLALAGHKERIRLYGMDAPESKQTCDDASGKRYLCGSRAAAYLAQLIGRNGQVRCFEEDRDRYGRIVAECATADGKTVLNAAMVSAGWAIEYERYSDGRYAKEQAEAKTNRRGFWMGQFVNPSQWRRGERLPDEGEGAVDTEIQTGSISRPADEPPSGACRIKGNISGSGKIYHSPGQRDYGRTQIDPARGERWFCSTGEAEAAGWRAAHR